MSLEDLFLKLTGGHHDAPARRGPRRADRWSRRDVQPGALDHAHARSGAACSRALRQERSGSLGQGAAARRSSARASGPRSSAIAYRVLRYFQQRARHRRASSRASCSASSCSPSSRSCCSPTSSRRSRPSSSPRISTCWSAAPVGWLRLYLAKLSETVVHSSWMVALLALPILTAYGIVFSGGPLFPLVALAAFVPVLVMPAVVGDDLHGAPGQRLPRPADARAAGPDRARRRRPCWCSCSGSSGPSGWRAPRGSGTSWTTSRCCGRRPARPAERVGRRDDHELADPGGGPVADRQALGRRRPWRWRSARAVHRRALPAPATRKAQEGAERKVRRPLRGPAGDAPAPACRRRSASSCSRTCGSSSATTPSGAS